MKKNYLLLMILLTGLSCKHIAKEQVERSVDVHVKGVVEPASTFIDMDGKSVELSDFKGKRILLNYWATWCRPCIEEMPNLLNAQEVLRAENYVFLLASDQSLEKIKAFKAKKQYDFTFLKFAGSLAEMQINALPATFIYNESGKIVHRIDGATEWDSPKILDKLKALQ